MANYVSTAPARADRGSDPCEKLRKTTEKRSTNKHTYNTDFTPNGSPKYSDETCENPTRCFSAPAPTPQTPLLKKLTVSHRNSNHSKKYFPSSCLGPPCVHPAASMVLQGGPEWPPRVLPRCQNGLPECQNGNTKPPKWQSREATRGRRQRA